MMRKDFDFFPFKIGDRIPQYIIGKKSSGKWGVKFIIKQKENFLKA